MKYILFFLAGMLPSICMAQWNTNNSLLEFTEPSDQPILKVKAVETPDGSTWLAYTSYTPGFLVDCKIQLIDNEGVSKFEEGGFSLISNSRDLPSSADSFGMICDNEGNVILCYPSAKDAESYLPKPRLFKINQNGEQLWGNDGVEILMTTENIDSQNLYKINDELFVTWSATDYTDWSTSTFVMKVNDSGSSAWESPVQIPGKSASILNNEDNISIFYTKSNHAYMDTYTTDGIRLNEEPVSISEEGVYVNEPWGASPFTTASQNDVNAICYTGINSNNENILMYAKLEAEPSFSTITSTSSFDNILLDINDEGKMSIIWNEYDYENGSSLHMATVEGKSINDEVVLTTTNNLTPMYSAITPSNEIFLIWGEAEGWSGSDVKSGVFNDNGKITELDLFFTTGELLANSTYNDGKYAYFFMPDTNSETYETSLVGMRIPLNCQFQESSINNVNSSEDETWVEYYTIDGIKVDATNLDKGIYIKRTNKGAQKVIF